MAEDPTSTIPSFNWGAFFMPPIWGVAHGQWAGVFFLPAWAFVDNVIRGQQPWGLWTLVLGWSMAAATLGLQYVYARNANMIAWRRYSSQMTAIEYNRRQRLWAIGSGIALAVMIVWIALFIASGQAPVD